MASCDVCVLDVRIWYCSSRCVFFQAEDGIRDLVRSRGLGDVYKRQGVGAVVSDVSHLGGPGSASDHRGFGLDASVAGKDLSLIHI